jgi:hypothetical protein
MVIRRRIAAKERYGSQDAVSMGGGLMVGKAE